MIDTNEIFKVYTSNFSMGGEWNPAEIHINRTGLTVNGENIVDGLETVHYYRAKIFDVSLVGGAVLVEIIGGNDIYLKNNINSNEIDEELLNIINLLVKLIPSSNMTTVTKILKGIDFMGTTKLIDEITDWGPHNAAYWRGLKKSSTDGFIDISSGNIERMRSCLRHMFQSAVVEMMKNKSDEDFRKFTQIINGYMMIPEDMREAEDCYKLYFSTFIQEAKQYNGQLLSLYQKVKREIKTMALFFSDREFIKECSEKLLIIFNNWELDGERAGKSDAYKFHYYINLFLDYARYRFLAGDYQMAFDSSDFGLRLFRKLMPEEGKKGVFLINDDGHEDRSFMESLELTRMKLEILMELSFMKINMNVSNHRVILTDFIHFYNKYLSPPDKEASMLCLDEELQWGVIYYYACHEIFSSVPWMLPAQALRHFLG